MNTSKTTFPDSLMGSSIYHSGVSLLNKVDTYAALNKSLFQANWEDDITACRNDILDIIILSNIKNGKSGKKSIPEKQLPEIPKTKINGKTAIKKIDTIRKLILVEASCLYQTAISCKTWNETDTCAPLQVELEQVIHDAYNIAFGAALETLRHEHARLREPSEDDAEELIEMLGAPLPVPRI